MDSPFWGEGRKEGRPASPARLYVEGYGGLAVLGNPVKGHDHQRESFINYAASPNVHPPLPP